MYSRITPLILFGLIACAANQRRHAQMNERGDKDHPVYVGVGTNGEIVVAASHSDAMNGLAVAAEEVGAKAGDLLLCSREMATGSHVPSWVCRYPTQAEQEREATQRFLMESKNCFVSQTAGCGGFVGGH